jgi:hypothetical protein
MTLKHVRPTTINSTKLLAFVLFAIGIAIFAYLLADEGILRRPPIASTTAWAGGFVLLALDGRKHRGEQEQLPPSQPPSSARRGSRRPPGRASRADEYTHQSSHF